MFNGANNHLRSGNNAPAFVGGPSYRQASRHPMAQSAPSGLGGHSFYVAPPLPRPILAPMPSFGGYSFSAAPYYVAPSVSRPFSASPLSYSGYDRISRATAGIFLGLSSLFIGFSVMAELPLLGTAFVLGGIILMAGSCISGTYRSGVGSPYHDHIPRHIIL